MTFIAIIVKQEYLCQWAFIPSHSSYENYDNLFLLSIRSSLLPYLCQTILPGTDIPTCHLCYSQLQFWLPFSRLKGISNGFCVNPRQWISQKSDDSISRVGWLDSPWRLQHLNVIRSNTDVLRHVCSLATAWSYHLWLIFPAMFCPLPHWTPISGHATSTRAIIDLTYQCQDWINGRMVLENVSSRNTYAFLKFDCGSGKSV